jgi:hypothetical protein
LLALAIGDVEPAMFVLTELDGREPPAKHRDVGNPLRDLLGAWLRDHAAVPRERDDAVPLVVANVVVTGDALGVLLDHPLDVGLHEERQAAELVRERHRIRTD